MNFNFLRNESTKIHEELVRRIISTINTVIPGVIVDFDRKLQTCSVRPCVNGVAVNERGQRENYERPIIKNVPVWFPYQTKGGFSLTYDVKEGDNCLIVFSQESFFNWWLQGKIQNQQGIQYSRKFDYNDAFAFVGICPLTDTIKDFQEDCIEIRDENRNNFVKVTNNFVHVVSRRRNEGEDGEEEYCEFVLAKDGDASLTTTKTITVTTMQKYVTAEIHHVGNYECTEKVTARMYSTKVAGDGEEEQEYLGVTGTATPLDTVIFKNGIAVEIISP